MDDPVDGVLRLMQRRVNETVNLGNPAEFTILELARQVLELTGSSSPPILFLPLPQDDPRQRRPDSSRARELLVWEPRVPLRERLLRTILRQVLTGGQVRASVREVGP